jgi:hypothetical protein
MSDMLSKHEASASLDLESNAFAVQGPARVRIQELVQEKLVGRRVQGVSFMDALLDLAKQAGVIHCSFIDSDHLQFCLSSQPPPFPVILDGARGKLRMLCARLSVLCNESGDVDVSLYGGEGTIKKESSWVQTAALASGSTEFDLDCPKPLNRSRIQEWHVRFKNTPGEHEFTITPLVK